MSHPARRHSRAFSIFLHNPIREYPPHFHHQNSRLWHSPNNCKATFGNKKVLPTDRKAIRNSPANVNAYKHGDLDPAWCATVQFERGTNMSEEPADLCPTPGYSPTATERAAERPAPYYKGPGFESRPEHRLCSVMSLKTFIRATKDAGTVSCNRLRSLPSIPSSFHHAQYYQHKFHDNSRSPTGCSVSCHIVWDVRGAKSLLCHVFPRVASLPYPLERAGGGEKEATIVGFSRSHPKTSSWYNVKAFFSPNAFRCLSEHCFVGRFPGFSRLSFWCK